MHASPAPEPSSRHLATAALVFVLCAMLSSARMVWSARAPNGRKDDIARRSDQRFAAVKRSLPARGVIGYLGEPGALALGDYYGAEYALAPLVVDHSANHRLVLANFPNSPAPAPGWQLVKDFGNGVMLFANKDAN
jgi:hypothetical protein